MRHDVKASFWLGERRCGSAAGGDARLLAGAAVARGALSGRRERGGNKRGLKFRRPDGSARGARAIKKLTGRRAPFPADPLQRLVRRYICSIAIIASEAMSS